jgi:hypothetical protein
MFTAVSHLVNAVSSFINNVTETEEQKYRRNMVKFLNQATDRHHLEFLEREWERKYGRRYW